MAIKKQLTRAEEKELKAMMKEDAQAAAPPEKIDAIKGSARELYKHINEVVQLSESLEKAKAEVKRITEQVLPPLMDEAAITALKLADNLTLERGEAVFASISKANALEAANWLEENGHGAIVKFAFTIPLEKGDTKMEKLVRKTLKAAKIGYEESCSVHPQTLTAFVKESLEAGRTLPDSIAVHVQPIVKLKMAKAKGAK